MQPLFVYLTSVYLLLWDVLALVWAKDGESKEKHDIAMSAAILVLYGPPQHILLKGNGQGDFLHLL